MYRSAGGKHPTLRAILTLSWRAKPGYSSGCFALSTRQGTFYHRWGGWTWPERWIWVTAVAWLTVCVTSCELTCVDPRRRLRPVAECVNGYVQPKLNTAQASSEGADYVVRQERALAIALVALALGVAANSILGPVGLGLMRYRTSATTLNQLLGSDAAALFVVVPITVAAAVLAFRRHPVAPLVAVGIGCTPCTRTHR